MSFIEITQSQVVLPDETLDDNRDPGAEEEEGRRGEEQDKKPLSLESQLSKADALFSILSSHSDVDHPICHECTSLLVAAMKARLGGATREREAYSTFLRTVQQNTSTTHGNETKSHKPNSKIGESLYAQLEQTEDEVEQLKKELGAIEDESRRFELQEQAFWTARNSVDDHLNQITVNLLTAQLSLTHDQQQLNRLHRTNVYNDTFCIGHDGSFGTINGLRLGRLPNQNVEWAEINAAWGQTLLLLATVAERLKYTFHGYRLRPQGSTSRIEKLEYPQQSPDTTRQSTNTRDRGIQSAAANPEPKITPLDLFSSGEMAIGRVLNHRRFDNGMVAFLDCLAQLGKYVERTSTIEVSPKPSLNKISATRSTPSKPVLPYTIQNDKIGDYSIKLGMGFGDAESFTRACKYILTCCKFLLAYVSNLESQRNP